MPSRSHMVLADHRAVTATTWSLGCPGCGMPRTGHGRATPARRAGSGQLGHSRAARFVPPMKLIGVCHRVADGCRPGPGHNHPDAAAIRNRRNRRGAKRPASAPSRGDHAGDARAGGINRLDNLLSRATTQCECVPAREGEQRQGGAQPATCSPVADRARPPRWPGRICRVHQPGGC